MGEGKCHRKKLHRKLNIQRLLIVILSILLTILIGFIIFNRFEIKIQLDGDNPHTTNFKDDYQEPGVKAIYHGTLLPFYQEDIEVTTSGNIDTSKEGEYILTYSAKKGKITTSEERIVIVKDIQGPIITLISNPDYYTPYNHEYQEEGFTAIDNKDGDVTDKVQKEITKDKVIYTATDSSGNTTTVERTIHYDDRKGPEITLEDGTEIDVMSILLGKTLTQLWMIVMMMLQIK